jgi:K+-sensing histidine kinase KdpD
MTASYLPPIALLFAGYRRADGVLRLRLRWMLWSSVVFVSGIFFSNSPILGYLASLLGADILPAVALGGFLYAVLRHRVVDVSVVLSRTLVYAMTTSLVLGLFALLESLIERSALGQDAGLLLELAVPLGLGAGLSTVHRRIEATVERLIFRRQYRTESALRAFAQECAFITQADKLLDLTVLQIVRHTAATRVALYEQTAEHYARVRQQGEPALPAQIGADDLAFVKLRARNAAVDLDDAHSDLGQDGYAFPLMVRGRLQGVLVVGEPSGERFAADERELLFGVAHEVGMALFALRAQESEARAHAAEARARASENALQEAHSREAALLNALRPAGSSAG